jgi:hypothetical protein
MIVYEVSLSIDVDTIIYEEYLVWIASHIKKILLLKGFIKAKSLEEIDLNEKSVSNSSIRKLLIQYQLDSMESLQEYLALHAQAMRKEHNDLYGDRVTASRKIYKSNAY